MDRVTLASVLRANGTLAPAAVCRVGRDVAHALVDLHAKSLVGAPSVDSIYVDGLGALLFPDGAVGSPADDLFALGAVLAEAALGFPFSSTGSAPGIRTLAHGLPERLVDAIEVLVAPLDARLKNASAAERIFTELERLYGDGEVALTLAVTHAQRAPPQLRDTSPRGEPKTVEMNALGVLSMDDLQRIAAPHSNPANTPDTQPSSPAPTSAPAPTPASIAPAAMRTERIERASLRDTTRLDDDDVIPSSVPRAAWIAMAVAAVVGLVVAAFAAGVHYGH